MQSNSKCTSVYELTVAYKGSQPGAHTKNDEYPLSLNHIADCQDTTVDFGEMEAQLRQIQRQMQALANEVRRMSEDIELLRQETSTSVVAQAAAGNATDEHQKIFESVVVLATRIENIRRWQSQLMYGKKDLESQRRLVDLELELQPRQSLS